MSTSFTKLMSSITASTVWQEDSDTRVVWVTMLAMCDRLGRVHASVPGLAHIARVPLEICRRALAKFLAPDPDSRTKDHEGRRIEEIDGGWHLLNYTKHRDTKDYQAILASKRKYINARRARERVDNVDTNVDKSRAIAEAEAEADKQQQKAPPAPEPLPALCPTMNTREFNDAWMRWTKYRREIGKSLKPTTVKAQLALLTKVAPAVAVAMIDQSILQQWTGLFEVKTNGSTQARGLFEKPKVGYHDPRQDADVAALEQRRTSLRPTKDRPTGNAGNDGWPAHVPT